MPEPVFVELVTTVSDREAARTLAHLAIEKRLAGCVQIEGPIASLYRWEGVVQEENEFRVILKTPEGCLAGLLEQVRANHPYKEPQLWVRQAMQVSQGYGNWLIESTR